MGTIEITEPSTQIGIQDNVNLHPSSIGFSQHTISNTFSAAFENKCIGVVVDELVDKMSEGDYYLFEKIIGKMKVGRWLQPGCDYGWFTVNNRSLWVLKQLEKTGKLNHPLNVKIDPKGIDKKRFTTKNHGVCVEVRAGPVGGSISQPASFWKYKQVAGSAVAAAGGVGAFGGIGAFGTQYADDDGYDSDEYYV